MGFRSIIAGLMGMGHPREQALGTRKPRNVKGLWPRDHNGQYISDKPTSKRNRGRGGVSA